MINFFKKIKNLLNLDKTVSVAPSSTIIDYNSEYEFYLVEDLNAKFPHPVDDYYLKLDDLSINLLISLKWINWGYKFFTSLAVELDKLDAGYAINNIMPNSIQNFKDIKIKENKKIILIDNNQINSEGDILVLMKKFYKNPILNPPANPLFNSNTKIHLKLKLNLREYLIISNLLYPTFIKWAEVKKQS